MRKLLFLVLVVGVVLSSMVAVASDKARLVVLTDLANEPDDEESLVRLLAYANEFDFEGIVATTSCHLREKPREDILRRTIDAYAKVWTNLVVHAPDYPSADFLRSVAASGQPGFGTNALDVASAGSRLLSAALKRDDPRTLWVSVWGGANTLHRALRDCREAMATEAFEAAQKKLRVYAISDQDDSGPAIRREFPLVTWIVDPSYPYDWRDYWRATWGGISGDVRGDLRKLNLPFVELVDNKWLKANIMDVGPLGACYPPHIWIMEGDTPSFLGLIRNGLGWSESPDYGGWGGRYVWRTFKGEPHPIWTSPEPCEEFGGTWRNGNSIVRWREDYQLDFAARIRWSVTPKYADANHNPFAVVNGRPGRGVLHLVARPGERIALDAAGTSDPDGDALSYDWQIYREASSLKGGVLRADGAKAVVDLSDMPVDATGDLHVILRVRDSGTPSLAAFRRIVIRVS